MASVSEHQPTTWASYLFDLHLLVFAGPAGMYFCFKRLTDENVFLLVFALTAIYFSGESRFTAAGRQAGWEQAGVRKLGCQARSLVAAR